MTSSNELKASLIINDSIQDTLVFDGKILENHFSIKKKMLLIPIPALLFHRERKTILGNDHNKNLVVTRGYKMQDGFL